MNHHLSHKNKGLYRTPGEQREWEVSYVREQARVWRLMKDLKGPGPLMTTLEPACGQCGAHADDLVLRSERLAWFCKLCGKETADGSAGRLVRR